MRKVAVVEARKQAPRIFSLRAVLVKKDKHRDS